jgi:hypothetical protein
MTVQYLNDVLEACQNAALKVVATVCDMGANNIRILKLLGATKRKPSFRFFNEETATAYNLPNLLKCTWNLFLKYDVQLKSEHLDNQLPVIAMWENILKLCRLYQARTFYQLCKLTDSHLNPVASSWLHR